MKARKTDASQKDLFGAEAERSLLDTLLEASKLYKTSKDYKELLEFVIRLRNFAPFNAMLLQVQKPGIRYAASADDWRVRYERYPKEGARPLIILWPFGPVALVYDVQDTEGRELPEDVSSFVASGSITADMLAKFKNLLNSMRIDVRWIDAGDGYAGQIQVIYQSGKKQEWSEYRVLINQNHSVPVQFATLAHELGHLALGHLGPDKRLKIPVRLDLSHDKRELEAESVAYLVCERNGINSKSKTYLSNYVTNNTTIEDLDVYQVMRAAGHVETMLRLGARTRFDRKKSQVIKRDESSE